MALPKKYIHQITDTRQLHLTPEDVIEALADLAGFTAYEVLDENDGFEGYQLVANDEELRDFLACEESSEQYENELVTALGSYMEDE